MRIFKHSTNLSLKIVDLPRASYRILPPPRWQVALTMAVIVVGALVWAVL